MPFDVAIRDTLREEKKEPVVKNEPKVEEIKKEVVPSPIKVNRVSQVKPEENKR